VMAKKPAPKKTRNPAKATAIKKPAPKKPAMPAKSQKTFTPLKSKKPAKAEKVEKLVAKLAFPKAPAPLKAKKPAKAKKMEKLIVKLAIPEKQIPKKPIPKKSAVKKPARMPIPKKPARIDTAKIAAAFAEEKREAKKAAEKPVRTGIAGLDRILGGGIEKSSVVVVTGGPGTGKSTVGLQFLYNGAKDYGENGMYITFEEQKATILRHAGKFGWDFTALENEKKLVFLEYPPHEVDRFLSEGGIIEDMIHEYGIKRIVIDSMTTFLALYDNEYRRRQAFLKLMETLRKWGCTAILTSEGEVTPDGEVHTHFGIEFLSDGLIVLRSIHRGDVVDIAMEVVKMRGIAYERRLVPVRFTAEGIAAYPAQHVFAMQ